MVVLSPITTPVKQAIYLYGHVRRKMHVNDVVSQLPSRSHSRFVRANEFEPRNVALNLSRRSFNVSSTGNQVFHQCFSKRRTNLNPLKIIRHGTRRIAFSWPYQTTRLRLSLPNTDMVTKIRWYTRSSSWLQSGASSGIPLGLSIFFSSSKRVYAEGSSGKNGDKDACDSSSVGSIHGKEVYTHYTITGIPGDGRCLFRSVAHGACLRAGKTSPNEGLQRELADELRARVADEFIKRREETEWFVEGDFDSYVSHMRKPHVWGGEPELFMSSHVLQMPITVYMYDENAGGLISIAEYGQEYGKENPIRVLYHGFGHYDALQIPDKSAKSKL